jgi:hypothetical protein
VTIARISTRAAVGSVCHLATTVARSGSVGEKPAKTVPALALLEVDDWRNFVTKLALAGECSSPSSPTCFNPAEDRGGHDELMAESSAGERYWGSI